MKRRIPQLDAPISRRRKLLAHEEELWRSVMEIGLLPKAQPEPEPKSPHVAKEPAVKNETKHLKKKELQPHRFDHASRSCIHKGKKPIEAMLDLHGFTVEVAHRMLIRFIARMQNDGARTVLVVTGKGRAPQSGILRAQLPHWLALSPLREQVSGYGPAGAAHGGEGAWYITIRKITAVKR